MNEYVKNGIIEGSKIMAFFGAISLVWAFVIWASRQMEISPGWAMLALFTGAIYFFSIATQKLKYESELARVKAKEEK